MAEKEIVIMLATDFRLPRVLKHIEAGRIVRIVPAPETLATRAKARGGAQCPAVTTTLAPTKPVTWECSERNCTETERGYEPPPICPQHGLPMRARKSA
jgi:hypothetical protein